MSGADPDPVRELQAWIDRLDDMRRVVMCRPELVAPIRAVIAREGVGGLVRVVGSELVPPGTLYLAPDPDAVEREAARRSLL